jgi:hypothetical protein
MVYWEKQNGGLCRKHSINAYYGKEKYNINEFNELLNNYDNYMINKGYKIEKSKKFDTIESNQFTIISYSLYLNNIYSVLIPFNNLQFFLKYHNKKSLIEYIGDNNNIFVFNENHIWLCKNDNKRWIKIDSLSGIQKFNINSYNKQSNLGFIIPMLPKNTINELIFNINKMNELLINIDIIEYLYNLFNNNLLIGNLEILLSNIINIFRIIIDIGSNNSINNIIYQYDIFLKEFENNRLNFDNIKNNIPIIINNINNVNIDAFKIN